MAARPALSDDVYNAVLDLWAQGRRRGEICSALGLTSVHLVSNAVRRARDRKDPRAVPHEAFTPPPPQRTRIFTFGNLDRNRKPVGRKDLDAEARPATAVRLLELRGCHCRWPLEGGFYCGAERTPGSSYCGAHFERSITRFQEAAE